MFKSSYPDAVLQVSIWEDDGNDQPLKSFNINANKISWSPKNMLLHPDLQVIKGKTYTIMMWSATSKGCYGLEYDRATKDSANPEFLYKLDIASK